MQLVTTLSFQELHLLWDGWKIAKTFLERVGKTLRIFQVLVKSLQIFGDRRDLRKS